MPPPRPSSRRPSTKGGTAERRVLASIGNEQGSQRTRRRLEERNRQCDDDHRGAGASGSKAAIAPLTERLQNPSPEIRGAAVEGLGKLGSSFDVVARIKPLLNDPTSYVRVKAAGALYGLNDMSGLQVLQDLLQAEPAASRLIAVQAMASRPDLALARSCATPDVGRRTGGQGGCRPPACPARPGAGAEKCSQGAMSDGNPAIREMASEAFGEVGGNRFPDTSAR